ncbi:hypothetical protein HHK36_024526 [Tetracentron sinense]|uniref:Pentatricopeptide repeat-containing protein n=1 Tax=Tetracentron sinense TaxID=13715 RepID=A0A834YQU3_TETSI|nr:hypothetical protein HHK36_024526 [Tetracentron sinense]
MRSSTLQTTLVKLHHCESTRELCSYLHYHLFRSFKAISSLTTPIERYPIKEPECNYNNSIELHQFSHVLQDCTDSRDLRTGMLVHTQLVKLASDGSISLWNKLLSLYCKCGKIESSRRLFDKMPERDEVSLNTMISTYIRRNRDTVEALLIYSKIQEEGVKPNHITLSVLISGCVGLASLRELIHGQAIRYGLSSNEFVGGALVDGYAKKMRLEDAVRAFNEIAKLDIVSWNIMIDGCVCNDSKEYALEFFSRMQQVGVGFDSFTLTSVTKTCSEPRELDLGKQLHGCVIKAGLASGTPMSNALITMYSKCEDGMVSATEIFEIILEPNIISWTAMIAGFMQNRQSEEAVEFYRRMLREGMKENEYSFASILPVYSSLASLDQGRQVHARIIKSRFCLDVSVGNSLIDMYSKCGSLADAQLVFTTMGNHDVVSCTAMITGFAQHGKGREALKILEAMANEGLNPDGVTFLGCLSACSHGGLTDEGLQVFRSMIDVHAVKPRREHYACVVDMLGRAGRLKEAERFIEDMRIESDALVWEALLGACRIHGEIALGEKSAEKIMKIEPERHGPYVMLANIYADRGLWEDKGKVRESLGASGLKKEVGRSWVV